MQKALQERICLQIETCSIVVKFTQLNFERVFAKACITHCDIFTTTPYKNYMFQQNNTSLLFIHCISVQIMFATAEMIVVIYKKVIKVSFRFIALFYIYKWLLPTNLKNYFHLIKNFSVRPFSQLVFYNIVIRFRLSNYYCLTTHLHWITALLQFILALSLHSRHLCWLPLN